MKNIFASALALILSAALYAQADNGVHNLFPTPTTEAIPYRIPAIAKSATGRLIAVAARILYRTSDPVE